MSKMLLSWDYVVWYSGLILQFLILLVILWRRILPNLLAFHLYLAFGIIRSVVLMIYTPHLDPTEYAVLYWRIGGIGYLFQAGLAAQIAMQCVKKPLSNVVFLFAEAIAVIEVSMIFTADELTTEPLVLLNTVAAMVCMGIIFLALVINSMSWPCTQLAWGMVTIMLGQVSVGLYRIVFGVWKHWEIVRRITPLLGVLTLIYWLIITSFGESNKKLQLRALTRRVG